MKKNILATTTILATLSLTTLAFANELPAYEEGMDKSELARTDKSDLIKPSYPVYTVEAGDTLIKIGAKFDVPYLEIVKLNNIENEDLIFVGQELLIPTTTATTPVTPVPPIAVIDNKQEPNNDLVQINPDDYPALNKDDEFMTPNNDLVQINPEDYPALNKDDEFMTPNNDLVQINPEDFPMLSEFMATDNGLIEINPEDFPALNGFMTPNNDLIQINPDDYPALNKDDSDVITSETEVEAVEIQSLESDAIGDAIKKYTEDLAIVGVSKQFSDIYVDGDVYVDATNSTISNLSTTGNVYVSSTGNTITGTIGGDLVFESREAYEKSNINQGLSVKGDVVIN